MVKPIGSEEKSVSPSVSDSGVSIYSTQFGPKERIRSKVTFATLMKRIKLMYPTLPDMIVLMVFKQVRRNLGSKSELGPASEVSFDSEKKN